MLKTANGVQPNPRRGSTIMSLSLVRDMMFFYVFLPSQHSGRPQSTVRLTKNEVPDNHPKRVWVAQVLAVFIQLLFASHRTPSTFRMPFCCSSEVHMPTMWIWARLSWCVTPVILRYRSWYHWKKWQNLLPIGIGWNRAKSIAGLKHVLAMEEHLVYWKSVFVGWGRKDADIGTTWDEHAAVMGQLLLRGVKSWNYR